MYINKATIPTTIIETIQIVISKAVVIEHGHFFFFSISLNLSFN